MKICRSQETTQNSTDMGPLQFMASATPHWTGPNRAIRATTSMATSESSNSVALAETYQESQMKRLLWKQDHPLLSDWPTRVRASTLKTQDRTATSSSPRDKCSRTELMSRTSSSKVTNSKWTRRICQGLKDLGARRTCSLSVQTTPHWANQSINFHRARTSKWTKPLSPPSALRSSTRLERAQWKHLLTFLRPIWSIPMWCCPISQVPTLAPTCPARKPPKLSVRISMWMLTMVSQSWTTLES